MSALTRYLYSSSNLVGATAALGVLGSYLFGVIDHGWLLLTIGAYVAGALPFAFGNRNVHVDEGLSTADALEQLKNRMLPKLPQQARTILSNIITRVEALMPRLKQMEEQGVIEAQSRAMLKQTVTRLLPDVIENYLRLPAVYAKTNKLANGKTAQQHLEEQLMLLNEHVLELEENLLSSDVNNLLANGQYLQEKLNPGLKLFD